MIYIYFLQINSVPFLSNEIERKNHKILYKKNEYSHKVKVDGWRDYEISLPFHDEPLCAHNINQFRSHYKYLGSDEPRKWTTTSLEASTQIYTQSRLSRIDPENSMVNIHTFLK